MDELVPSTSGRDRASLPRIVVVGAAGVGKTSLCKQIVGFSSETSPLVWHINNKYYKADLEVCEVDPDAAIGTTEALVLVFNLNDDATLTKAKSIATGFDLEAIEVKVLCGTHADVLAGDSSQLDSVSEHPVFQHAADWSIENGFEFVACCPAVPTKDAELVLDGDRQGVPRVVEALQAHTWPNLELHDEPREPGAIRPVLPDPAALVTTSGQAGPGEERAAAGPASSPAPKPPAPVDEASSAPEPLISKPRVQDAGEPPAAAAVEAEAGGKQRGAGEDGGAEEEPTPAALTCPEPGGQEDDDEDADEDAATEEGRALEGFERLLQDMQGHKARLAAGMSDQERRSQAEALVLRMLQVMELGGEGEEEDEEDSEGDK